MGSLKWSSHRADLHSDRAWNTPSRQASTPAPHGRPSVAKVGAFPTNDRQYWGLGGSAQPGAAAPPHCCPALGFTHEAG